MSEPRDAERTKNQHKRVIRVAILAEELLGWGSGKRMFPEILQKYSWTTQGRSYIVTTQYIFDNDIVHGRLTTKEFDVLLVPGGGVGDGQAITKGFHFLKKVRKWKKNIAAFIQDGGGYIGICGGTALITDLKTTEKKPRTFFERQYNKSALGVTCVSSYYKSLAFPLFYPFQKNHPEDIGATAYVFSFAPGITVDGTRIHTGGAPIDFQIQKDHPIFSDVKQDTERIRWWGGPALIVPEHPNREVHILAKYPAQDISDMKNLQIHAWRYVGGIHGLFSAFLRAAQYIKKQNDTLKNLFLYTYYLAGNWELTDKSIKLDYSDKPCITAEIYPNEKKGRILLCASHPEYMVWRDGRITERKSEDFLCLGTGLYQWKDISSLSKDASDELTHTWWMVRRFVAWAAKVPDSDLPPIEKVILTKEQSFLIKDLFWDGSLQNQMDNI
ncbi:MAG TPA: hypothetical protein VN365_04030 [Candidatus Thermoplasmatota archaeon]|nr:hypothetical protein [Candidatus Thermoplasmatota archaeon]